MYASERLCVREYCLCVCVFVGVYLCVCVCVRVLDQLETGSL